MFSRILCCAFCACVVSPAMAVTVTTESCGCDTFVVQDGDYYDQLWVMGPALQMTGGQVDLLVLQGRDSYEFNGGVVQSMSVNGSFDMTGGRISRLDLRDGDLYDFSGGYVSVMDIFSGNRLTLRGGEYHGITIEQYLDVEFVGSYFRVAFDGYSYREDFGLEGWTEDGSWYRASLYNNVQDSQPRRLTFTIVPGSNPGDVNMDWQVDLVDLNLVRNSFGEPGQGDLDGSGIVDLADLNLARNNFGAGSNFVLKPGYPMPYVEFTETTVLPPSPPRVVPEPSSLTLTVLALCALAGIPLRHRSRRCCQTDQSL